MTDTKLYRNTNGTINDDADYFDANYSLAIGATPHRNGVWSIGEDPPTPEYEESAQRQREPDGTTDPSIAVHGVSNVRDEVWKQTFRSAGHKLLYMALIRQCGNKNWWVGGHKTLAKECSSSTASIERWMRDHVKDHLVVITSHQYKNCNCYTLPNHVPINFTRSKAYWDKKRGKKVSSK